MSGERSAMRPLLGRPRPRWLPALVLIELLLLALLTWTVALDGRPGPVDRAAAGALFAGRHNLARTLAAEATVLGFAPIVVAIGAVVGACVWWRRHDRVLALLCPTIPVLAISLTTGLKVFVARQTPAEILPPGERGHLALRSFAGLYRYSFPSGHATGITALAVVVVAIARHLAPEGRSRSAGSRMAVGGGATLVVVVVALSRVVLGVHYLTDVAAGILTGSVVALTVLGVADRRRYRCGNRAC